MGEVASPGTFTITNEKVNIMEALAMAGRHDRIRTTRQSETDP